MDDDSQSAIRVLGAIIGICTYCDPLANITSATIDRTMRTNASLCSFMPSQSQSVARSEVTSPVSLGRCITQPHRGGTARVAFNLSNPHHSITLASSSIVHIPLQLILSTRSIEELDEDPQLVKLV